MKLPSLIPGSIPYWRQLYHSIREQIANGTLSAHQKLPSTRELADMLGTSRNVILECYDQLLAEGYVYSEQGSGTYVCEGLTGTLPSAVSNVSYEQQNSFRYCFRTGIPDLSKIPVEKWTRLYRQVLTDAPEAILDYGNPAGCLSLRQALCEYLARTRGIDTSTDNILITSGAAQAFHLLSAIVSRDEYVLCEDPCSNGLLSTLQQAGLRISYLPVDAHGVRTELLPEHAPKLLFTTPSHQFPSGGILPATRRAALLAYATKHNSYVVEDDYDSEFRYEGYPISPMHSMNRERVIYVGTFSKTFMPSIRLGYLILPDALLSTITQAKYASDISCSTPPQLTLARFIQNGHYAAHIHKMKQLYLSKRRTLCDALREVFGEQITICGERAGLHLLCHFHGLSFPPEWFEVLKQADIEITPATSYAHSPSSMEQYRNSLLFGFGNIALEDIFPAVLLLKRCMFPLYSSTHNS